MPIRKSGLQLSLPLELLLALLLLPEFSLAFAVWIALTGHESPLGLGVEVGEPHAQGTQWPTSGRIAGSAGFSATDSRDFAPHSALGMPIPTSHS